MNLENDLKKVVVDNIAKIDYSYHINLIASTLDRTMHGSVSALERFEKKKLYQEIALTDAKKTLGEVGSAAQKYINTVDDLLYYSQVADFAKTRKEIEKNNYKQLEELFYTMDNWFKQIGLAHTVFIEKFDEASRKFTKCVASCDSQRAKARKRKQIAALVQLLSVPVASIAIAIGGVLTLGISTFTGKTLIIIAMGAGGGTYMIAKQFIYWFKKAEDSFKSMSLEFRQLTQHGIEIKNLFEECHVVILNYKTNYDFLKMTTDQSHKQSQFSALHRMELILESARLKIAKVRQVIILCSQNQNSLTN